MKMYRVRHERGMRDLVVEQRRLDRKTVVGRYTTWYYTAVIESLRTGRVRKGLAFPLHTHLVRWLSLPQTHA